MGPMNPCGWSVFRIVPSTVVLACVLCTYLPAQQTPSGWDLFIASGRGDGRGLATNKVVRIVADANTRAQVFDRWEVRPETYWTLLADPKDPTTTFTTPGDSPVSDDNDIVVTAIYTSTGNSLFVDRTSALTCPQPPCKLILKDHLGVSWGDHNNDGFVDFLADRELWTNNGGTGFTATVMVTGDDVGGGIWGDYDNDGDLDVFNGMDVETDGSGAKLYRNDGDGRFVSLSFPQLQAVVMPEPDRPETRTLERSNGATWFDWDKDGDLDLYVGGFGNYGATPYFPDMIARNDGNGVFSIAWSEEPRHRMGRGVVACDFDRDFDQDIYVANYALQPNYLWLNGGAPDYRLEDVSGSRGVAGSAHTIGPAWGDFDNDGSFDLFVANLAHSENERSHFYRNSGPPNYTFEDKTPGSGLAYQESIANPALGDYDNDGDLDLFLTTVYPNDRAVLYRNNGDWTFTNVTAEVGLDHLHETEQQAWADFDNDGDLDLVTDGKIHVNGGNSNHWLKLRLSGDGVRVNRSAIGAQVEIALSGGTKVARQVEGGMAEFNNQNDLTLHFGLGRTSGNVALAVRWPDGTTCNPRTDRGVDVLYSLAFPCGPDADGDCICDANDNCPNHANLSQQDTDADGQGDACEN